MNLQEAGIEGLLRLRCLELATQHDMAGAIEIAQRFYDFIKGTNDTEIIRAARAVAEAVNAKK